MLAAEPDLDELDAAAYAAAHGMPPPARNTRRDGGRDGGRGGRDGRDGRDTRDGRERDARRGQAGPPPPPADPTLQADGYKAMERVFLKPGAVTRWPLYLRQAKAVLRAGDEGFDERKYGFAGLVEALRYGQREGLFRLDRDRQGVLRVYPGQLLQRMEGGGAIAGGDAGPAQSEPSVIEAEAPPASIGGTEPIEETAPLTAGDRGIDVEVEAPAAKASKRRAGAAKKPAAKKAAPKARAAKAAAPRKRAAKKSA